MKKENNVKSGIVSEVSKPLTYVGPDYQNTVSLPTMPHPINPRELPTELVAQYIREYPAISVYFEGV